MKVCEVVDVISFVWKKNFRTFRLIKWNRNLNSRISQTIYMLLCRPLLRKAKFWDSFISGNQLPFSVLKITSEIILRIQHRFLRNIYAKNAKQSHCRPGEALRIPGGWGCQILRQSAHKDMISYHMMWYDMIWNDMLWYGLCYDICYDIWYDMIYVMIYVMMYDICYVMIWYDMIWYDMIWYDIFVNCSWVDTRWQ